MAMKRETAKESGNAEFRVPTATPGVAFAHGCSHAMRLETNADTRRYAGIETTRSEGAAPAGTIQRRRSGEGPIP